MAKTSEKKEVRVVTLLKMDPLGQTKASDPGEKHFAAFIQAAKPNEQGIDIIRAKFAGDSKEYKAGMKVPVEQLTEWPYANAEQLKRFTGGKTKAANWDDSLLKTETIEAAAE